MPPYRAAPDLLDWLAERLADHPRYETHCRPLLAECRRWYGGDTWYIRKTPDELSLDGQPADNRENENALR